MERILFSLSAPITKLTYKEANFQLIISQEERFQETRDRLTSTQVLTLQDGPEGNAMYYYASSVRLVFALINHIMVIAYASSYLEKNKKNNPIHNLELTTVIHAFNILRHY
ncbi:hypothetical protein MTR67_043442 [Solanum verrucosum]|uniref:Reverse transcriptase/retrotransposon-derived protein RNase H-like domain-containing protein n=1 Tax=Solanum verrucosum TaxID=315347 RepID=A0AAF0ZS31_SOLVR|nr:hypothetical protein MTR67_043442 [Solanum verrucosum]